MVVFKNKAISNYKRIIMNTFLKIKKEKSIGKNTQKHNNFIKESIYNALVELSSYHFARNKLSQIIDHSMYSSIIETDTRHLPAVQEKKYLFLKSMLDSSIRNIDKGYFSKSILKKLLRIFVGYSFLNPEDIQKQAIEDFNNLYGIKPPTFLVISPTQNCNLSCTGCYASSGKHCDATLPYDYLDRILEEAHDKFGIRFITVSGGEPFMYKNSGKTLLDIFKKYRDIFFLVYTNGTLINKNKAQILKKLENVTPAISVEGFKEQTEERRGKTVYTKILNAFENLRNAGVPFGISVTATSKNLDILLDDRFYDLYLDELGATYMWQFQLMPIGRAKDSFALMVQPEGRLQLYRKWEDLIKRKNYCVADFWNSGVLSDGCIAYGRNGGYLYIDWNGNITPCVFVPYASDNIYELFHNGKGLTDALFSDFMIKGRNWQDNYGLVDRKNSKNCLMPCSIRDHYDNFIKKIYTGKEKSINQEAEESLLDSNYYKGLVEYDKELNNLTEEIWQMEYLEKR